MENTEDCPVKIQKMINELRKDHLGTLDRFLRKAYNLDLVQKSCKFITLPHYESF